MEERVLFINRLKSGEAMTQLCQEFGISRKTGYKFLTRYELGGAIKLLDESRKPLHSPLATPEDVKQLIRETKLERPTWGAGKIRVWLMRKNPGVKIPSRFTVHEILTKAQLVMKRPYRKSQSYLQTPLIPSERPNQIWCADFKGQFQLGNRKYCYPLTITDLYSRYLLTCEGLEDVKTGGAERVFERAFREYGLPDTIRTDNGAPFASSGMFGLSMLSVWWLRLGINLQRIAPGHPEQNGQHERMHLTLKADATRPAAENFLHQQEKFDSFQERFNQERPHESLEMKTPSEFYKPSTNVYPTDLEEPQYPLHDLSLTVGQKGDITLNSKNRITLTQSLYGQKVGLREEDLGLWRISFMKMDLGFYDADEHLFKPFQSLQPSEELPKV